MRRTLALIGLVMAATARANTYYCPTNPVRRDQMAAFLYNTFHLP